MLKQKAIFYPNSDIIKEFYEYIDDVLVYMEETNEEQTKAYGLDYELKEYWYSLLNGKRIILLNKLSGAVFAAYVTVELPPLIIDGFTPRRAISSRYALATVNPNFYGVIDPIGIQ